MSKTVLRLPDEYDPYDMRIKVQFHPQADQLNVIMTTKVNPSLRCGAMKGGKPCKQPAGAGTLHPGYGRCRLHGGNNTGPKTAEGKAKSTLNNVKHGLYSKSLTPKQQAVFDAMESVDAFDPLDYSIKMWTAKIISYLQDQATTFTADAELEGEEMAYRKSRVICREGDGVKSFYHAGTIEDNALDRAFNTLRRLVGQKHIIDGKEASEGDIMYAINSELRAASRGQVSVSWGGNAQNNIPGNE